MDIVIGSLIIIVLFACLYGLIFLRNKCATYKDMWEKWENEYWLLRNSKAIKEDYVVNLSWLPIGIHDCIRKR